LANPLNKKARPLSRAFDSRRCGFLAARMNRRFAFAGTARNVNGSDDSEQCDKKNLHSPSDHQ
jgi:hypothetical protein